MCTGPYSFVCVLGRLYRVAERAMKSTVNIFVGGMNGRLNRPLEASLTCQALFENGIFSTTGEFIRRGYDNLSFDTLTKYRHEG